MKKMMNQKTLGYKESTHQTNKDKCSIVISWYCLVVHLLYWFHVLCMFVCLHLYYWNAHDGKEAHDVVQHSIDTYLDWDLFVDIGVEGI